MQNRPKFLRLPEDEWQIKSAKDLAATARESINKLQRKAFAAALTRSEAKQQKPAKEQRQNEGLIQVQIEPNRPPAGLAFRNSFDIEKFSDLTRLVKTVAWVWRAAKRFLNKK